jgi:3-oxoacid CoA-transferase subunit B
MALTREQMAQRVARELKDGYYVNLGIGIPTLVANYVPAGMEVMLQSENGLLGMGEFPPKHHRRRHDQRRQANRHRPPRRVDLRLGAVLRHDPRRPRRPDRAGRLRGGRAGNIASWMIPGKLVKGMGGAMDLVAGADNIIVTMTHASKDGESKLLPKCSLPLTGAGCIRKVLTDLAYLEIEDGAFILRETAPG